MSWTPDEAYEEALRRIREAEETGEVQLDLKFLLIDFLELGRLTSLQSLDLSGCEGSGDAGGNSRVSRSLPNKLVLLC